MQNSLNFPRNIVKMKYFQGYLSSTLSINLNIYLLHCRRGKPHIIQLRHTLQWGLSGEELVITMSIWWNFLPETTSAWKHFQGYLTSPCDQCTLADYHMLINGECRTY